MVNSNEPGAQSTVSPKISATQISPDCSRVSSTPDIQNAGIERGERRMRIRTSTRP